jgi:hypothetical protein
MSEITPPDTGLAKLEAIPFGPTGVTINTMAAAWTFANAIVRANLQPRGMNPAQVMIALQMGAEIGLPPMQALKNIAVINGRPTVWGDALLAIAYSKNLIEDISETISGEGDDRTATCAIKRKGLNTPTVRVFSVTHAKKAGLWGKSGPWSQYPDRMLAMRARGFALRDAVPDALGGFTLAEEAMDMQVVDVQATSRSEQLLGALTSGNTEPNTLFDVTVRS